MLWDVIKELGRALRGLFGYHIGRVFGRRGQGASLSRFNRGSPSTSSNPTDVDLNPNYLTPTPWPTYRKDAYTEKLLDDPLFELWLSIEGGHKWDHYFSIYREVFESRKGRPMRILEIGVYMGSSMQLWKQYFSHPDTLIVGIDIDATCSRFDAPQNGIHVRIGSQTDAAFLATVCKEFGPFDLIIDDGSHKSSHIIISFNELFQKALREGGIYLVEDLHANYWLGWRDSKRSFLQICYELVEHMHAHYRSSAPDAILIAGRPSEQINPHLEVPLITNLIREIRFFDSIVVLYKEFRPNVPYALVREIPLDFPPDRTRPGQGGLPLGRPESPSRTPGTQADVPDYSWMSETGKK